ncbi:MAG: hypothetical protein E7283_02285 [Lachnospiraceae bacterium]|nr:hypothetical protein [Lachnospiraceae bacterium]
MQLPENDYQILKLTPMFYSNYLNQSHTEILKKNNRAYNCLLFQTHYNFFVAVPYRSEVAHKYAYHFRYSKRSKKHKSGLDYTKIIIVGQNEYLDTKDAIIDNDEYNETIKNFEKIKREVLKYVEDYINYVQGKKVISEKEFERRYKYSTLKYFHRELALEE